MVAPIPLTDHDPRIRYLEIHHTQRRGWGRLSVACIRHVGKFSLLTTHQHVTWNIPITAPLAAFQAVMAWGVGSSSTEHPLFWKYSAASSESSTLPPCPDPRISCLAPASSMCSASARESLCDVPYFAFDSFFLRFCSLPLKRITTSCSYRSPDIVMLPNSVLSMDGLIA